MKTIVTKRPKVKYIPIETEEIETVETYKTVDGEEFEQLRDATHHEAELRFRNVDKTTFWFPMVDDIWYKAKDADELEFLKNYLSKTYGKRYGESRLKVGEWFTVVSKDRDGIGNFADHFLPLSKLKEDFAKLLEQLEGK
jgi:hypothetical protein